MALQLAANAGAKPIGVVSSPAKFEHCMRLGAIGCINRKDFNSRILVLIDGRRTNENVYDQAFIDAAFALDVEAIERVEFVAGPGSSLYGNNAMLGVVNVVTRQASGQRRSLRWIGAKARYFCCGCFNMGVVPVLVKRVNCSIEERGQKEKRPAAVAYGPFSSKRVDVLSYRTRGSPRSSSRPRAFVMEQRM